MKIAIFGKKFNKNFITSAKLLFEKLNAFASETVIYSPFVEFLDKQHNYTPGPHQTFSKPFSEANRPDMLISVGGDGTFLDATEFTGKLSIPMVGINSGRLGFLANISEAEIETALEKIHQKQYSLEKRILLKAESSQNGLTGYPFCLNELSIQKHSSDSMITISVYIDNDYLNSYWADGLIIATPTGSTAYSLSAGGPIMLPEAQSIIVVPIAPHNLTVRPIIIPKKKHIRLEVKSRSGYYLCSTDSRTNILSIEESISIQTADFKIKTILPTGKSFYDTLRNKLMWGADKRN